MMRTTIGVVFAAAFTISGAAQDFIAQSGVPAVAFPKPDRPVADIVSPIWHDERERDDAGEAGQIVRLLGIKSGMTVADIGAGSGYYVVRLSPIVGSNGRIVAEDIVPNYLQSLRKRVRNLGLQNVVISLGEPHDPKLPAESVDIAILVHMYDRLAGSDAYLAIFAPPSVASRTRPEAIVACKAQ
jgi:predicted methyltransferase